MPLPAGVQTVTVTFGPYLDMQGQPARGVTTFAPTKLVKHLPSGSALLAAPIKATWDDQGNGSVVLPAVDSAGLDRSDWGYRVTHRALDLGVPSPLGKTIQPLAAAPTVDLDLLADATTTTGTVVSLPALLSVAGLTGSPTAQQLADALEELVIPGGGAGGALSGSYPSPGLNVAAVDNAVEGLVLDSGSDTSVALRAAFESWIDATPITPADIGAASIKVGRVCKVASMGMAQELLGGDQAIVMNSVVFNQDATLFAIDTTGSGRITMLVDGNARLNMSFTFDSIPGVNITPYAIRNGDIGDVVAQGSLTVGKPPAGDTGAVPATAIVGAIRDLPLQAGDYLEFRVYVDGSSDALMAAGSSIRRDITDRSFISLAYAGSLPA